MLSSGLLRRYQLVVVGFVIIIYLFINKFYIIGNLAKDNLKSRRPFFDRNHVQFELSSAATNANLRKTSTAATTTFQREAETDGALLAAKSSERQSAADNSHPQKVVKLEKPFPKQMKTASPIRGTNPPTSSSSSLTPTQATRVVVKKEHSSTKFFEKLFLFHDHLLSFQNPEMMHCFNHAIDFKKEDIQIAIEHVGGSSNWYEFVIHLESARNSLLDTCGLYLQVEIIVKEKDMYTRGLVIPDFKGNYHVGFYHPTLPVLGELKITCLHQSFRYWFDDRSENLPAKNLIKGARSFKLLELAKLLNVNIESYTDHTKASACPESLSCGYWIQNQYVLAVKSPNVKKIQCKPKQTEFILCGDSLSRYHFRDQTFIQRVKSKFPSKYIDMGGLRSQHHNWLGVWDKLEANQLFDYLTKLNITTQVEAVTNTIIVLNVGIRDIARLNTFTDYSSSFDKLITIIQSLNTQIHPIWRLTSAIHEDKSLNDPAVNRVDYRNTMTSMRNQVNSFIGYRKLLSSGVDVIDGYLPSYTAPLSALLPNDIRHYASPMYDIWNDAILAHCKE